MSVRAARCGAHACRGAGESWVNRHTRMARDGACVDGKVGAACARADTEMCAWCSVRENTRGLYTDSRACA